MTPTEIQLVFLLLLAVVFDFLNGFNDSANVVATMIASQAMSPRYALMMTAAAEFCGPLIFGVAVAATIGSEVVSPGAVTTPVVLMALLAASMWNLVTWFFGLPSSSSHALIGGLVGAGVAGSGWQVVHLSGLLKVLIALFISPFLGFLLSVVIMRVVIALCASASPVANVYFKFLQIPTGLALALSHGANDAQKTMGVITLGLVVLGYQKAFHVPLWVILLSAGAMALGTAIGGWRIIRTLGGKFYRIRPIHGFVSQFSAMAVVLTASLLGGPVSTSQVVSSAIVGAGAAQRRSQVRWGVLGEILVAWLLTIPASAGLGALLYIIYRTVFR